MVRGKRRHFVTPPNQECWIESDSFDRQLFRRLSAESASLAGVIDTGGTLVPRFAALIEDFFALCFKGNVVFRDPEAVRPSAHPNRSILQALTKSPALAALRAHTTLDEVKAGLGAVLLGEEILAQLRKGRVWTRVDLQELGTLAADEEELRGRIETYEEAIALAGVEPTAEDDSENGDDAGEVPSLSSDARTRVRNTIAGLEHDTDTAAASLRQKMRRLSAVSIPGKTMRRLAARAVGTAGALAERQAELQNGVPAWGIGLGSARRSSVGQQLDLGKRLVTNPKLKRLADLVGRMHESAMRLRKTMFERANEETYSVARGRDLGRLLPQDLLGLTHPTLGRDFRRRLVEGQLGQYDLRGAEEKGRGPMVVCLDGSTSMEGEKELWAKAVTLTLLDIARRQRRLFRCICFAAAEQPLWTLDLNPKQPYAVDERKIYDLAEYFPGGGTDFETPLKAAVDCLWAARYRCGDIVLITDGECRVSGAWLEEFRAERGRLGCFVFSVLIDVGASTIETVRDFSDRVTSVSQLTDDAARDLFLSV